jgi:NADH dehydrogenase I D subunit
MTMTLLEKALAEEKWAFPIQIDHTPDLPTLIISPEQIMNLARRLKEGDLFQFDFLIDITAVDLLHQEPRFLVVYHLYSMKHHHRVRINTEVRSDSPRLDSVVSLWPGANWYEREVYDMFGIYFTNHPGLKRILMPSKWVGHPLRKDYPLGGEEVAFTNNLGKTKEQVIPWDWLEEEQQEVSHEVSINHAGEIGLLPEGVAQKDPYVVALNMGPQHPGTHGLLRLVLWIEGELIVDVEPHIGYLHTGIEKSMERLTYPQALTMTDRADYLANLNNNLAYCMAIENLLGLEIPPRAQYARVILNELERIASHMVWLAALTIDLGIMSTYFYCFERREEILDIKNLCSGVRMMTSYITVGGIRLELPDGFEQKVRNVVETFPAKIDELEKMMNANPIWINRLRGIATLSPEEAIAWGVCGPNARASGINHDLRKRHPYSSYDHFDFDIPLGTTGDVYDRYLVRMEEFRQSLRIIKQALDRLPGGPFKSDNRKVVSPPREELEHSMEAVIHHFLLASDSFVVPKGQSYAAVEGPRGELGYYIYSDGGNKPYRVKIRDPSFVHAQVIPVMAKGGMIADVVALIGSIDPVLGGIDR